MSIKVFYNDNDLYCVEWLNNLIEAGHLPEGTVDGRSIEDLEPADLDRYTHAHFFCGLGGWPYALELTGWPPDQPVWTGSPPCQPFSAAGKRQGDADSRDLWSAWFRLIQECRPATIFGEQVDGAIGWGWWDRVCADLEGEDYACAAALLPACSVGAPHLRNRLFWVATLDGLADAKPPDRWSFNLKHRPDGPDGPDGGRPETYGESGTRGEIHGLGNTDLARPQGRSLGPEQRSDQLSAWAASTPIWCSDGKWRRVPLEPRFQPLADGLPGRRVAVLRAAGNAIVSQVAAEFVRAFLEVPACEQ